MKVGDNISKLEDKALKKRNKLKQKTDVINRRKSTNDAITRRAKEIIDYEKERLPRVNKAQYKDSKKRIKQAEENLKILAKYDVKINAESKRIKAKVEKNQRFIDALHKQYFDLHVIDLSDRAGRPVSIDEIIKLYSS